MQEPAPLGYDAVRVQYQVETAEWFLSRARDYLAAGKLLAASESGWSATERMLRAVAEERGWSVDTPEKQYRWMSNLRKEMDDRDLLTLFSSVRTLRQNFYEGWFSADDVEDTLRDVEELMSRLRSRLELRV